MEKFVLEAKERKDFSKSYRNQIRKNNIIPGIYYSRHNKPVAIEVNEKSLKSLVYTSKTHLVSLMVDDKEEMECIIKDVQFDPLTDKVVHFDLLGLTKGETFQLEVPIQLIGSPIGVKEGGILQQTLHKVEIECFPKDIPEHITVDIANLKLNSAVHVGDLQLQDITFLSSKESVIVSVVPPKVEKEVTPVEAEVTAEEPEEPELVTKTKETEKE